VVNFLVRISAARAAPPTKRRLGQPRHWRDDKAITMTEAMPSEPTPWEQAIIAAYRAGNSIHTVGAAFGVGKNTVWKTLVRHNEPRRQPGKYAKPPTLEIAARDAAVIAAYRDRQSVHAVSRSLGLSVSFVWKLLVRHGVPRRTRPEPRDPAPIIAGYRAGLSQAKLGAAFGISRARVGKILKRHGQSTDGRQE
jgi:transposase